MGDVISDLRLPRDGFCVSSKVFFGSAKDPRPTKRGLSRKHVTDACHALSTFENVRRRMEVRGRIGTGAQAITVYDDFAHHPTAIRTTVNGLRRQVGGARILAIFEPRSNTMKLGTMKSQLPDSLSQADLAFCHSGGLDWDAREALAPMGARATVCANIPELVQAVVAQELLVLEQQGAQALQAKVIQVVMVQVLVVMLVAEVADSRKIAAQAQADGKWGIEKLKVPRSTIPASVWPRWRRVRRYGPRQRRPRPP